jgi:curved DNA-binding protein CbpA
MEEATEKFKEINEAYDILSNPQVTLFHVCCLLTVL